MLRRKGSYPSALLLLRNRAFSIARVRRAEPVDGGRWVPDLRDMEVIKQAHAILTAQRARNVELLNREKELVKKLEELTAREAEFAKKETTFAERERLLAENHATKLLASEAASKAAAEAPQAVEVTIEGLNGTDLAAIRRHTQLLEERLKNMSADALAKASPEARQSLIDASKAINEQVARISETAPKRPTIDTRTASDAAANYRPRPSNGTEYQSRWVAFGTMGAGVMLGGYFGWHYQRHSSASSSVPPGTRVRRCEERKCRRKCRTDAPTDSGAAACGALQREMRALLSPKAMSAPSMWIDRTSDAAIGEAMGKETIVLVDGPTGTGKLSSLWRQCQTASRGLVVVDLTASPSAVWTGSALQQAFCRAVGIVRDIDLPEVDDTYVKAYDAFMRVLDDARDASPTAPPPVLVLRGLDYVAPFVVDTKLPNTPYGVVAPEARERIIAFLRNMYALHQQGLLTLVITADSGLGAAVLEMTPEVSYSRVSVASVTVTEAGQAVEQFLGSDFMEALKRMSRGGALADLLKKDTSVGARVTKVLGGTPPDLNALSAALPTFKSTASAIMSHIPSTAKADAVDLTLECMIDGERRRLHEIVSYFYDLATRERKAEQGFVPPAETLMQPGAEWTKFANDRGAVRDVANYFKVDNGPNQNGRKLAVINSSAHRAYESAMEAMARYAGLRQVLSYLSGGGPNAPARAIALTMLYGPQREPSLDRVTHADLELAAAYNVLQRTMDESGLPVYTIASPLTAAAARDVHRELTNSAACDGSLDEVKESLAMAKKAFEWDGCAQMWLYSPACAATARAISVLSERQRMLERPKSPGATAPSSPAPAPIERPVATTVTTGEERNL